MMSWDWDAERKFSNTKIFYNADANKLTLDYTACWETGKKAWKTVRGMWSSGKWNVSTREWWRRGKRFTGNHHKAN